MMIHAFKTVLQCIYIASVVSLTGDGEGILFHGKKHVLNGNKVIQLNCSSETKPALSYAEILIDGKTAAAATYDEKTQECLLGQSIFKNCSNVCQCSSDGKTFIFTLPLPTTQKALDYSCVMYIINKHRKEVVNLKYSGTDFGPHIPDSKLNNTTDQKPTTENVGVLDTGNDTQQTDLYVPLSIVSTILVLLVALGIIYFVKQKTTVCRKKKDKDRSYKIHLTKASTDDMIGVRVPLIEHKVRDVGTCTMCQESLVSKETQCDFDNNESETEEKDTCDICSLLGKIRRAKTKCMVCEESMCLTCGDIHQAMKVTSIHKLIQIEKIPKSFSVPSTCTTHSQSLEYICKFHDRLCCKLCVNICGEHEKDKCDFEVIDDQTGDFKSSKLFNHYSLLAKQLPTLISSLIYHLYQNIDDLGKSTNHTVDRNNSYRIKCLQLIAKETENINDVLNNILNNLEFVEKNALDKFLYLTLHSSVPMFDEITGKLKLILSKTKDIELLDRSHNKFFSVKDIKDKVQNLEPSPNLKQSQVAVKM